MPASSRPRRARASSAPRRWRRSRCPRAGCCCRRFRSHDQFNTTIYGLSDRYRGIENGRRVIFVNPEDISALGFSDGDVVDIISEWEDGSERSVPSFRIVAYETPRGCAAAYYPEVNPLVPLDSTADGEQQPTYKSLVVRLERESSDGQADLDDEGRPDRLRPRPQVRRPARPAELNGRCRPRPVARLTACSATSWPVSSSVA